MVPGWCMQACGWVPCSGAVALQRQVHASALQLLSWGVDMVPKQGIGVLPCRGSQLLSLL